MNFLKSYEKHGPEYLTVIINLKQDKDNYADFIVMMLIKKNIVDLSVTANIFIFV
jgi:hypothetical protein